jgi:hypothetical protein
MGGIDRHCANGAAERPGRLDGNGGAHGNYVAGCGESGKDDFAAR